MNLFELDSVKVKPSVRDAMQRQNITRIEFATKLRQVVEVLVVDKPLWTFRVDDYSYGYDLDQNRYFKITYLNVYQGEEKLGVLRYAYKRNEECVEVYNHRIQDQRERSGGFTSKDVKKVVASAKKNFGSKTLAEIANEARDQAADAIHKGWRSLINKQRQSFSTVRDAAMQYVMGDGFAQFVLYLDTLQNQGTAISIKQHIKLRDEIQVEVDEINRQENKFNEGKSLLVTRHGSGYITRLRGETKIETDSTLPESVRTKLGMLKLVEVGTAITSMGFRSDENTFIVCMEDENGT